MQPREARGNVSMEGSWPDLMVLQPTDNFSWAVHPSGA